MAQRKPPNKDQGALRFEDIIRCYAENDIAKEDIVSDLPRSEIKLIAGVIRGIADEKQFSKVDQLVKDIPKINIKYDVNGRMSISTVKLIVEELCNILDGDIIYEIKHVVKKADKRVTELGVKESNASDKRINKIVRSVLNEEFCAKSRDSGMTKLERNEISTYISVLMNCDESDDLFLEARHLAKKVMKKRNERALKEFMMDKFEVSKTDSSYDIEPIMDLIVVIGTVTGHRNEAALARLLMKVSYDIFKRMDRMVEKKGGWRQFVKNIQGKITASVGWKETLYMVAVPAIAILMLVVFKIKI